MRLRDVLRPGDQIAYYTPPKLTLEFWNYFVDQAVQGGIAAYQRRYGFADFKPYHVTPVCTPDYILNAKPPLVCFSKAEDVEREQIRVLRPNFYTVSDAEAAMMISELMSPVVYTELGMTQPLKLIGSSYQIGEIADLLINAEKGHPDQESINWFDGSQDKAVCSTSSTLFYNHLRKKIMEAGRPEPFTPMFSVIPNPALFAGSQWKDEILADIAKQPIPWDCVTPAHYTNQWFNNTFTEVYRNF
jgi:hypothetical protein